ncbi:MAG: VOC family protein [Microbacterium sp.]
MSDATNEKRGYPHGVPCWIDVEQSDARAGREFYSALFGWDFIDAGPPGSAYAIARLQGKDVGGLEQGDSGAGWVSYVACDDIDATCTLIRSAGGTILVAPSHGEPGASATCADPQGAVFRLWQAGTNPGAQIVNEPGAWNFSDLQTPDPDAALAFYGEIFGWRVDPQLGAGMIRLPGYGKHLSETVDPDIYERQQFAPEGFEDVICGLTEKPDAAASWLIRFTVADRDATAASAEDLGAAVESTAETEWTREAVIVDPQGARFVVSQLVMPD